MHINLSYWIIGLNMSPICFIWEIFFLYYFSTFKLCSCRFSVFHFYLYFLVPCDIWSSSILCAIFQGFSPLYILLFQSFIWTYRTLLKNNISRILNKVQDERQSKILTKKSILLIYLLHQCFFCFIKKETHGIIIWFWILAFFVNKVSLNYTYFEINLRN